MTADSPEVQAVRRRLLCEAMAQELCVCPVCKRAVPLRLRERQVGQHEWGFRRCEGVGAQVSTRLVPIPIDLELR